MASDIIWGSTCHPSPHEVVDANQREYGMSIEVFLYQFEPSLRKKIRTSTGKSDG